MWFGVITLFPEMFQAITQYGVTGRAVKQGLLQLECWNPRGFVSDRHQTIDDRPYGGGPGMVMMAQPLRAAIQAAHEAAGGAAKVAYLSPQGKVLRQQDIQMLARRERMILVAGRYEGIDERVIETDIDEEWSIGDYVLSGGELPAMVLIDALARLLPGVLGHEDSAQQDSFHAGLLDCPHYTRPEILNGQGAGEQRVPEVLLGGNHEAIRRWRLRQALGRTWLRRPDLLAGLELDLEQQELLEEFKRDDRKA